MLFAILFGLSMDYNVFLLCRIHEAYNEGDGPRESVIHGMARIGKVILFAGLIMAAVFLAFVTQPDVIAKMMGLGLGLAILIDVLLVRLVIAPAVVTLLGDNAWWLPRWLDRILPNVSLEGHLVRGPRRARGRAGQGARVGRLPGPRQRLWVGGERVPPASAGLGRHLQRVSRNSPLAHHLRPAFRATRRWGEEVRQAHLSHPAFAGRTGDRRSGPLPSSLPSAMTFAGATATPRARGRARPRAGRARGARRG